VSQRLMGWEAPDLMDDRMEEMLQIWMQFKPSSCGGVLLYVRAPEGSKGAGDEYLLHVVGRPPRRLPEI